MKFDFFKQNKFALLIVLLSIFVIVVQAILFRDRFTIETYPFVHQDFWRRITDALYFAGQSDTVFVHPPVPSLLYILSFLFGDGVLFILNGFHFILGSLFIYFISSQISKKPLVGVFSSLFFICSATILQQYSYYGLVDGWCLSWILVGIFFFLKWRKSSKKKYLVITGFLTVFAALIQYAGFFVLPFYLLNMWFVKKSMSEKIKESILLLLPIIFVFGGWQLFLYFQFGQFFFSKIDHFIYFIPNIVNLWRYLFDTITFATIPVIILAIVGIPYLTTETKRTLIFFSPYFIFFVLLYFWYDHRFIIYWIVPLFFLASLTFEHIVTSKNTLKYLAVPLFAGVLLFSNIYSPGFLGMPLPENTLIHSSKIGLKLEHRDEPFYIWSIYFSDINNRYKSNPELEYFRRTSSQIAKDIVIATRGCVKVDKSDFVKAHQLIYYSEVFNRKICLE